MCSVFGYITKSGKRVSVERLQAMAVANVGRGPHAFGLAWVDRRGQLHTYKQAGNVKNHLHELERVGDALMCIGHLRWATHGRPNDNRNNHPHPILGGALVHNGVVLNYDELLTKHDLIPHSECDSEVFGLLAEKDTQGAPVFRLRRALEQTMGRVVVLTLWGNPAPRLLVARSGNPLCVANTAEGKLFSTLPHPLPGIVFTFPQDQICEYTYAHGTKGVLNAKLRQLHRQPVPLPVTRGAYAGG